MKLITITEAAARIGVDRQTLINWGVNGVIRMHNMGKKGSKASLWVDASTIAALADDMRDVQHARTNLDAEHKQLRADYEEELALREDIERELRIAKGLRNALLNKEFYECIPPMLARLGIVSERESLVAIQIINGCVIGSIADGLGVTRTRVVQIFHQFCRKAVELGSIEDKLCELEQLREEVRQMKRGMDVLGRDLLAKQAEERRIADMERQEKIAYISKIDPLLKLLNTPITDFQLSVRVLNCLKGIGAETIGDLAKMLKTDLLKIRNFGKKSMRELDELMERLGLDFYTDVDEIYRQHIASYLAMEECETKPLQP